MNIFHGWSNTLQELKICAGKRPVCNDVLDKISIYQNQEFIRENT